MKQNMGAWDRLIRIFVGIALITTGYYFLMDWVQVLVYVVALALIINGATGRCGVLALFKTNTCTINPVSHIKAILISIVIVLVGGFGILFSNSVSKSLFINDIREVNDRYKELVFDTERGNNEEAIRHYEKLLSVFGTFYEKHQNHTPIAIKKDAQFVTDLATMKDILESIKADMYSGDLSAIASKLSGLETILQDIAKRNGLEVLL